MTVIWYDSSETGAPVLNNAAGSLLSVVQACLIDGFNSKSASIVVASNVATVTVSAHGYSGTYGKLLRVAGATPAGLNGDKQITVTGANTFTYPAPGVANGTATGTITCKRAALDWTRAFTGTNKAVYKSSDVASTGMFLRIDDTGAGVASPTDARAKGYESMTDVDTGSAPFPAASTLASTLGGNGYYWCKGANSVTAKKWTLIGDGLFFYLLTETSDTGGIAASPVAFGDIVGYRTPDPFRCMLTGAVGTLGDGSTYFAATGMLRPRGISDVVTDSALALARVASGVGGAVDAALLGYRTPDARNLPGVGAVPLFPSPVDNGLVVQRSVLVMERNPSFNHPFRGEMPGLMFPLGRALFGELELVPSILGFSGQAIALTAYGYDDAGTGTARFFVDLTGPWR